MEFTTQEDLYIKLLPAFKVKKRLIGITKYKNITNADIWTYLSKTKWKYSHNLTIAEVVNDIITIEIEKVNKYIGGTK